MDQGTLVTNKFDDGRELLQALAANGMVVNAAFWGRSPESKLWMLYLVSEDVEKKGVAATYRIVGDTLHQLSNSGLSTSEITVLSPSHPLYTELIIPSRGRGGMTGRRLPLSQPEEFDELYIYPPQARPTPMPSTRTQVLSLKRVKKGETTEDVTEQIGYIDGVLGEDEFNTQLVKLIEDRYGSLDQFQATKPRIILEAV